MNIDDAQYSQIISAVYQQPGPLPAAEADTILAIAKLAMAADVAEASEENSLYRVIARHVHAHAQIETPASELAAVGDDDQRRAQMRNHAAHLQGTPSADLAYALAYILMVADLELAPTESAFIEDLREALGLSSDRADELAATISQLLTPPDTGE